jgi:hypothetical protein
MAIVEIKRALERKLMQITPAIATAFENVAFTPVAGTPYQRVVVSPSKTVNPTFGSDYYREIGELQIFLAYPTGKGSTEALTRAALIQDHFKRGMELQEGAVTINFFHTPKVQGSLLTADRLVVPVIVPYDAEVLSGHFI